MPLLNTVILESANDDLVNVILLRLGDLVKNEITSDPFILGFRDAAFKSLDHRSALVRDRAVELLLGIKGVDRGPVLMRGLKDPDPWVRLETAYLVRTTETALVPQILSNYQQTKDPDNRARYCDILSRFHQVCATHQH